MYGGDFSDFAKVYLARDDIYLYVRFELNKSLGKLSNPPSFNTYVQFRENNAGEVQYQLEAHFQSGPEQAWEGIWTIQDALIMSYPSSFF